LMILFNIELFRFIYSFILLYSFLALLTFTYFLAIIPC